MGSHPSMTEACARPVGVPSTTPGRPCGFEWPLTSLASPYPHHGVEGRGYVGGGVKTGNPQRIVATLGVALPLFPYILGGGAPSLARSWGWWSKRPSKEYPFGHPSRTEGDRSTWAQRIPKGGGGYVSLIRCPKTRFRLAWTFRGFPQKKAFGVRTTISKEILRHQSWGDLTLDVGRWAQKSRAE